MLLIEVFVMWILFSPPLLYPIPHPDIYLYIYIYFMAIYIFVLDKF